MTKQKSKPTAQPQTPLPDKPLVFMHIPRTGGHTLRAILSEVYGDALCPAENWAQLCETQDIARYKVFHAHVGRQIETLLGDGGAPDYATFLREPMERMYSLFLHLRDTGQIHPKAELVGYTLNAAVQRGEVNEMTRYLSGGGDLDVAITTLSTFKFVGNFRYFEDEIHRLASLLGWAYTPDIPQLNSANVADVQRQDVAFFGRDTDALENANILDAQLYRYAEHLLWV